MDLWGIADYDDVDVPAAGGDVPVRETNLRLLFPEEVNIGALQRMLSDNGLHVHNTRADIAVPVYRIVVQDLLLVLLHFGEGKTYNEALSDAANKALRFREQALKKGA